MKKQIVKGFASLGVDLLADEINNYKDLRNLHISDIRITGENCFSAIVIFEEEAND